MKNKLKDWLNPDRKDIIYAESNMTPNELEHLIMNATNKIVVLPDFNYYKTKIDESFEKISPQEFVNEMEVLGYKFDRIKKAIPVNIWDDYYDDCHIPEGMIQKTYIYVEDSELSMLYRKKCLEVILKHINENVKFDGVKFWIELYDSYKKHPSLVGTEYEWCLFKRWEIKVENLSHIHREQLVNDLNNAKLSYDGVVLNIYSES